MLINSETKDLYNEFVKISTQKKQCEQMLADVSKRYDELKTKFAKLLDEEALVNDKGETLLKLKLIITKIFDQTRFKAEHNEMFEQYKTKESAYYRVSFNARSTE